VIEGNIGNIYDALGHVSKAIASFERSLAIKIRCLPPGHYSLVDGHANLGHMHLETGNYTSALNHFESALAIEKKADHGSHKNPVSLSNILMGFGLVYLRQNKPIQALLYCNQALKVLPADHPDRVHVYRQFGAIYREMGAYQAAIESYRKAIALSGDNEIKIAEHLHSLGLVQADKGESDQAIDSFKRALEIRKRLLPPSHPSIAKLYNEMGGVFLAKERFQEALDYFQQTRTLELESLPENHIETARTLNNIGVTLYKLDRPQEALTFVNQAVEIARQILDDTDSLRIMFQNTAAFVQKRVETGNCEGVNFGVK
jgi:tetratricopeptide (TPR) repeat protein